jgi:hypothetical protein
MKITPDYKDRNDGLDNDTVRYYESVDEEGYFYELYVLLNGVKGAIIVTDAGVSVEYREGELGGCVIRTDIIPEDIFGDRKDLNWNRLNYILHLVENNKTNGWVLVSEEMDDLYEYWKSLPDEEK